jgi:hypothetical protein
MIIGKIVPYVIIALIDQPYRDRGFLLFEVPMKGAAAVRAVLATLSGLRSGRRIRLHRRRHDAGADADGDLPVVARRAVSGFVFPIGVRRRFR